MFGAVLVPRPRRVGAAVVVGSIVAALLTALSGCDGADSIRVVREAEDRRAPDSAELIRILAAGSHDLRVRAAVAMGRIQSASYAAPLIVAASDTAVEVRVAALFALGQLGLAAGVEVPPEVVSACTAALEADDPRVVLAGIEALGKLAAPASSAALVRLLERDEPSIRSEAAYALFRLRFAPLWRREVDEPAPFSESALRALIGRFGDAEAAVRRAAAYAFARFGDPRAVADLAALVEDDDEWTRMFALRAIGRSGVAEAVSGLGAAFDDASPRVRTEAIRTYAELGGADLLPLDRLDEPSLHVRAALASALASATGPASLAALGRLAGDSSPTVRGAAVEALATRRGGDFLEALGAILADEVWPVRVAAVRALAGLGEPAAVWVVRAREDGDPRVRTAAIESAGAILGPGSDLVRRALESADLAERGTAVAVVGVSEIPEKAELLVRAYAASGAVEWIEVRESIVDALAGLEEALPLLRSAAAEDPAESVRRRARRALAAADGVAGAQADPALDTAPPPPIEFVEDPVVALETTRGTIEIRCLAEAAPNHVANFVGLVREGFYDGLLWHRVVPNFVIQGGDPRGDGWGGTDRLLRDEINARRFERGVVGMPKAGKDTGSCQIFITHVPTPHLDGNYTVFGVVRSGLDVIDRIEVGDAIVRARVVE